jgi:uncharacterized protein
MTLAIAGYLFARNLPEAQSVESSRHQYVVLLKRGPKWVPNKTAPEQPLLSHGRYLDEQMSKGALQLAGPFLDDSGGLILFNARDEAEVRAITEHDPGIVAGILEIDSIRPFRVAFDAATGKSPFKADK